MFLGLESESDQTKQKQPLSHLIVFLGLESESGQTKQTASQSLRMSMMILMTIAKLIRIIDSDNENTNYQDDGNDDDDNNNDYEEDETSFWVALVLVCAAFINCFASSL